MFLQMDGPRVTGGWCVHLPVRCVGFWCFDLGDHDTWTAALPSQNKPGSAALCQEWWTPWKTK